MKIEFLGKDPESSVTGSPTVYKTDRDSYLVQGWKVTDDEALMEVRRRGLPDHEDVIEIPARMVQFFR